MSADKPTILVTGASGQLATLYVKELLAIQATYPFKLIAASRSVDKLSHLKEKGVEVRKLDAFDHASIDAALVGVDRVVLVSLDTVGTRYTGHKNIIDGAIKAGVKHIIYSSAPVPVPHLSLYDEHFQTEAYLTTSTSIGYTLLRNPLYAETLLMSLPGAIAAGGQWALATGDAGRSYLTRSDLALAGALAATTKYTKDSDRHTYELTGSDTLSATQVAKLVNDELGTAVKPVFVSFDQLVQILSPFLPAPFPTAIASIDAHTKDGYDLVKTNHFEQLAGRAPVTLSSWIKDNKQALLTPPKH